jgi:hypothetical protein
MVQKVRYGEFVRELRVTQTTISYNALTPSLELDANGNEIPYRPKKLKLQVSDVSRLLTPYISVRIVEQLRAVLPLALYLALFQLLILRQTVADSWIISAGLFAVIIGLMLFMEGLKLGLMPFAEEIGDNLPKKSTLPVVLIIAFLLGIGVTFAEPAIGALQAVGSSVDVTKAPYLYALLTSWANVLILTVGVGVGFAAVLGTMRFLYGWSLKPYIYIALVPTLGLTFFCFLDPELSKIIGLAWDSGAVTTGPVTVPLVLSLGIGIAAAGGKGDTSLSGFGIVTLASIFPIIGVLSLSIYMSMVTSPEAIIAAAQSATSVVTDPAWYEVSPGVETIGGMRAIIPLVIFLYLVLRFILKVSVPEPGIVLYGLTLSVLGMIVFSLGLSYGLAKLGEQSGSIVPAAFTSLDAIKESPLYFYSLGIGIAIFFAWALGFGATLAEPALNALGTTVENLTNGAFQKKTLMYAVSIGVGVGLGLGVTKIIFDISIAYLLFPGYLLAMVLTWLSSEEFVNIAWDSAGVTTGPVTVPLVLAMGLGFGNAVGALDGFGILSMASICPILSVLSTGIFIRVRGERRRQKAALVAETQTT